MKARAIRGTALSIISFGSGQFIRLVSNLILTRILFPDAFGLIALVQVLLIGLDNFSDFGIGPAIIQSKRGTEKDYLNTAWTIQVVRGFVLWIIACALTIPVAEFYRQPELLHVIPVLSLVTIIDGFCSTRRYSATREIKLEWVTVVELASQLLGTLIMILVALWLRSVWALVVGSMALSLINTVLSHILIPGPRNTFRWDREAFHEIFHFSKYIFIGTIAGYFLQQGDRLILGRYVSLNDLAIFSIAQIFATLPLVMSFQLVERIVLPLYRNRPPIESDSNRIMVGRARALLVASLLLMTAVLGVFGESLIEFLYDERYHLAGPFLVLISISIIPRLIFGGYNFVLLANGNSRAFTILTCCSASFRMCALVIGIQHYGVVGAIVAPVIADILAYPFQIAYVNQYKGWYGLYDLGLLAFGVLIAAAAFWANPAALALILG
ncbi:oligosaccharide flippase family protein [Ruegeria arenilitoris]|uniref:oligosaccharide flippase family protein n=1 Tax=Ruegeria arenilitoris TaxID=1173585 RepID=UPI00148038F3|nr:oligosaccharide flippase family protein [Ruegeria arenilitoris]